VQAILHVFRVTVNYNWVNFPEVIPIESGYYYAEYIEKDNKYFKAIWWNESNNVWCKWNPKQLNEPKVLRFVLDSGRKFYTECLKDIGVLR
jgi:hypothetical protein